MDVDEGKAVNGVDVGSIVVELWEDILLGSE